MATTDYSPIVNALRGFAANYANMEMQKKAMEQNAQNGVFLQAMRDAQLNKLATDTRLNQQKYDMIAPVAAALSQLDFNDLGNQNRAIAAANGKSYTPYSNIGNTGATYDQASGQLLDGMNPLLRSAIGANNSRAALNNSAIQLNAARTRAQDALTALRQSGGGAGGAGGNGSSATYGFKIPDLFAKWVETKDVYGNKKFTKQIDVAALNQVAQDVVRNGGDLMRPEDWIRTMGAIFPQQSAAPASGATAGSAAASSPQMVQPSTAALGPAVPQVAQQVVTPQVAVPQPPQTAARPSVSVEQGLNMIQNPLVRNSAQAVLQQLSEGTISAGQAKALLNGMGIQ